MINQMQNKLLTMLDWFHNFCVENEIKYYAVGGTVLGAIRHGGFIPWDDDIDIALPRKEYNKLLSLFKEKQDHYYLETPYSGNDDYLFSYSKLYDTETILIENTNTICKRGIYIDIFPLDGIGNTQEEAYKNFKKVDKKNMFLMTRTCAIRKERVFFKNLAIVLSRCIPSFIVNNKNLSISLDKLCDSLNKDDSFYVANLMGAYRNKEIIKSELLGTPIIHEFEDINIYIPEKYEEYLVAIYGNWKELPPEDKRKTNHDFIEIDLNKSYM